MSFALRLLALVLLLGSTVGAADRSSVERIRYVGTVSYSRVVVDLSRATTYRVRLVPADAASGSPIRVVLDVDQAKIGPEAKEPLTIGDALLTRIRTGQFTLDTARIVLDLAREADYRVFTLPDPYRLVVDLRTETGGPAASEDVVRLDTARDAPPAAASRPRRRSAASPRRRLRATAASLRGHRSRCRSRPRESSR